MKIWYKARPDPKRPGENHQLLDFLNQTRLVKAQPCPSVPAILDFGVSHAGTFVVSEWIDGFSIDEYKGTTKFEALKLCKGLVDAVAQLHALQLSHGDLSPEHVLLDEGKPRFIDMIDFFPEGGMEAHNLAYGPPESEGATAQERDCYAVAKICSELLIESEPDEDIKTEQLIDELARCLPHDLNVYRLDRIKAP